LAPSRPGDHLGRLLVVIGAERDPVHPVQLANQLAADLGARLDVVPPRYDEPVEHRHAVSRLVASLVDEL
jgi:hypothetical protein